MSVLEQDKITFELNSAKDDLQKCIQFVRDQEFYERLESNPDWMKAKEDLTKEMISIKNKQDEALQVLIESVGSRKVDIQDLILELAIRMNQTKAFLDWFPTKIRQLKEATLKISDLREKIVQLQGELNGG